MKKSALFMMLSFVLAVPVVGAAQANDTDVPDKAEVMKFLDLMHAKAQMVQALDGMAKQMRLGAEQGFKEKVPDATPEQLARVDHMFDDIFKSLPIDDMVDAIVPIYQKHLTKADLAVITAFYASPTGQKILKEMPAIMSEAMQAGGEIGRKAVAARSQELDQKIAELVKETKEGKKSE
jgi:hypothetical protein